MSSPELEPLDDLPLAREVAPSPALSERIKRECTTTLNPVRSSSPRRRLTQSALVALLGFVLLALPKLHEFAQLGSEVGSAAYGTLAWAVVLSGVLVVGLWGGPGRRASVRTRLLVVLVVPAAFLIRLALITTETLPTDQAMEDTGIVSCGINTFITSAVVALGIMLPWRRSDPFNPGLTGALLGLGGALAAGIAMGLVCPNREGWHLWLSHGLTLVAVVALGAWLGRRWLAP